MTDEAPDAAASSNVFSDIPREAFDETFIPEEVGPDTARPLAGEVLPNEPTHTEVLSAALNLPCKVHVIEFEGEQYPIVDLTNSASDLWLSILLPLMSDLEKSLAPKAVALLQSLPVLNLFRSNVMAHLKEIAFKDDIQELKAAFQALEIQIEENDLISVQEAARVGRGLDFIFALAKIAWNSMGAAKAAFGDVSLAAILDRVLGPALLDLVVASLTSSLRRNKQPYVEAELRDQLDLMDKFDQWNVVYLQYLHYQESGKISRFFQQSVGMGTKSTGSATRSASTTKGTPS